MKNQPLVSVIIPTYNRADKVGDAINSVLNQTYNNIEILVIDDGSEDHTSELMHLFPQVEYIKQKHAGQAAARNNGLKNARGSIIANLDSDDLWNPDFLEYGVQKLEEDQLDFVFANWVQEEKSGNDWDFLINDPFLFPFFDRLDKNWVTLNNEDLRELYLNACPSPSSAVILRRTSIVSGWDENINIGDDWALYLDMILSKRCKAAFTLKKMWKKRIDSINIFDGRSRSELLSLLYIDDIKRIILRHSKKLSPDELKSLQRIHIYSLVELSKHKLVREFDITGSLKLFYKACSSNTIFALKVLPIIILKGLQNNFTNAQLNTSGSYGEKKKISREIVQ